MAVGVLLLSTAGTQTSIVTVGAYAAILGVGIGLALQVLLLAALNALPSDLGTATSTVIFARSSRRGPRPRHLRHHPDQPPRLLPRAGWAR